MSKRIERLRRKIQKSEHIEYVSAQVVCVNDDIEIQITNGVPEIIHTVNNQATTFDEAYAYFQFYNGSANIYWVSANEGETESELRIRAIECGLREIPTNIEEC